MREKIEFRADDIIWDGPYAAPRYIVFYGDNPHIDPFSDPCDVMLVDEECEDVMEAGELLGIVDLRG